MNQTECEKPFWLNPVGIFTNFNLSYKRSCPYSIWNLLVRLLIVGVVIGIIGNLFSLFSSSIISIVLGVIVFLLIVTGSEYISDAVMQRREEHRLVRFADEAPKRPVLESFEDSKDSTVSAKVVKSAQKAMENTEVIPHEGFLSASSFTPTSALPEYTMPSARNPFMNILLDDIKYNPQRPPAAPVSDPVVKQTLDDYFRVQWFSDPTDVYGKNQSQRQFIVQPSTSVPNDRESYQNWLYKIPGKTCKEAGGEACYGGSDGGPIPWLNING